MEVPTIQARRRLSFALSFIVASVLVSPALVALPATGGASTAAAASCAKFFESNISGVAAGLTFGPQNRIWVSEGGLAQPILRGVSPGGGTDVTFPLGNPDVTGMYDPQGLAAGPDGRLWIASGNVGHKVAAIDPTTGAVTGYPVVGSPMRIAASAGSLWVTVQNPDAILRLGTTGAVLATYALAAHAAPFGITAAADGSLWFTESGSARIGRLTPTGGLSEFPVGGDPWDIAVGASGVWFTERAASKIGHLDSTGLGLYEVPTPTPAAVPLGIAVGADGGIWFTEHGAGKVGRLDPVLIDPTTHMHVINETLITTSSSPPTVMLAVPDGTIWFGIEVNHLEHFKPNLDGTVGPLPPSVALIPGTPVQSSAAGPVYSTATTFTIGVSSAGQCLDGVSYRVYLLGSVPGPFGPTVLAPAAFTLGNGTWVVEFVGTGPGGSSLTQSTTLFVDQSRFAGDTAPPTLTLPPALSVAATSVAGAVVTYAASAVDAVDGSVPISCLPVSGTTFPIGGTTVRCSASDRTGNTAFGSFVVSVLAGPPVVTVPGNLVVPAAPVSTVVTFAASAKSPWGGAVPLTCTPPGATAASPATFAYGFLSDVSTMVLCTAVDGRGQLASSTFTVTPVTPPRLQLPANIVVIASGTTTPVRFTVTARSVSGAILPVTCTPASGSAFAVGTTTVICSANDRGIVATGTFTVTVSAAPPPDPSDCDGMRERDGNLRVDQRIVKAEEECLRRGHTRKSDRRAVDESPRGPKSRN